MTEKDRITAARSLVDAFNKGNWSRFQELMVPDAVYNELGTQRRIDGLAEIIEAMKAWKEFNSDVKGTVTNALTTGDSVALEVTWEGTQSGELVWSGGTHPPSGHRHVTPAVWVLDFAGDRVRESRMYFDLMTLLNQIGAMPATVS